MAVLTYPIPNLVQGVSQQSPQQRRDTQAQAQRNVLNNPVEGCVARPGADIVAKLATLYADGAWCYEIARSNTEHYLVVIANSASGQGVMTIYDLADGSQCLIYAYGQFNPAYAGNYINIPALNTGWSPEIAFAATSVEDTTFIVNRSIVPAMGTEASPTRQKEALFHCRAGAYATSFTIQITTAAGVNYYATYTTPSNELAANEAYAKTNVIMQSLAAGLASGSTFGGGSTGALTTNGPLPSNFAVANYGNLIHIYTTDGSDFFIDTTDGQGDSLLVGIKDTVQSFGKLPNSGVSGFTARVKGDSRSAADDYWVRYVGTTSATGVWEECPAPGTILRPSAATMPLQLINTAYRTFEVRDVTWGARVAGDGVKSAKTPSFIGRRVEAIIYDQSRLGLMTDGSISWSKSRNPFVFFPDTVQTRLDDAPIDIKLTNSKVAILKRAVQFSGTLVLFADGTQYSVRGTQDGFTEKTVSAKAISAFDFSTSVQPYAVGTGLFFAAETGSGGPNSFTSIHQMELERDDKAAPLFDATAHVPRLIPGGCRWIAASDTLKILVAHTNASPSSLWVYQWLDSGKERVQSAWNEWVFPNLSRIVWAGWRRHILNLLVHRPDGAELWRIDCTPKRVDAEGGYLTRLDRRITEAAFTSITWIPETGITRITLPHSYGDSTLGQGYSSDGLTFVVRADAQGQVRGKVPLYRPRPDKSSRTVDIEGYWVGVPMYCGQTVASVMEMSPLYIRTEKGSRPLERVQVSEIAVVHAATTYYRGEVYDDSGGVRRYPFEGRVLGDPKNLTSTIPVSDGQHVIPVKGENNRVRVLLVNDSPFPSAWQTAEWRYQGVDRTAGSGAAR